MWIRFQRSSAEDALGLKGVSSEVVASWEHNNWCLPGKKSTGAVRCSAGLWCLKRHKALHVQWGLFMFEFVGKSFLWVRVSVLWINVILHSWIAVYDHNTVQIHVWKLRSRKRVENYDKSSADECGWSCLGTSNYVKYFSTLMDGSKRPFQILLVMTVLPKDSCPGTFTLKLPL